MKSTVNDLDKPVLQNALVFLVEAYLKPVLDDPSRIGYCKI